MKSIVDILPIDAYLATYYSDEKNNLITRRVYYNDGRVEAFDGKEWWTVCQFTPLEKDLAMKAVLKSGLMRAKDLTQEDVHDTAILTFAWRLPGSEGLVSNFAYPAIDHPVFDKLESELEKLETQEG